MEKRKITAAPRELQGAIRIPGDKSISHRSVMFSGLSDTPVHITNFLPGADCRSTVSCMQKLGVAVEWHSDTELTVTGNGLRGLQEPAGILDAGNSGTTLRLLLGILAPQPFLATFTGDQSLQKRPMGRVIKPLCAMGAKIVGRADNRFLPITLLPAEEPLHGMDYHSPVASAQVKSALLLAGLYAEGETRVTEPAISRDHTERMLAAFGVSLQRQGTTIAVTPPDALQAPEHIEVPGDISSAAYWLVAASLIEGSDLRLLHVGVNPTRTGILDVLQDMGADIVLENEHLSGGEPVADLHVRSAKLHGVSFGAEIMPRLIDEIPILAVAAMFTDGDTKITGAGELRVKETDRLAAITAEYNKISPCIDALADGLIIHGGRARQFAACASYDDHRMAMSLAIAGLAGSGVAIDAAECVRISYPSFYETLEKITAKGFCES